MKIRAIILGLAGVLLLIVGTANAVDDPILALKPPSSSDIAMLDVIGSQEDGLPHDDKDVPGIDDLGYEDVCGGCCGSKGGSACCGCSAWHVAIEGLLMRRDQIDSVPLIVGPAGVLLNSRDLNLDYREGFRLSAARQINPCNDIEFEFFFVDNLGSSTVAATPGAQFTVYGAAFGAAPIALGYSTNLYNYEANWRHSWGSGRVKTLIGFRAMQLGEDMTVADAASPPQLFLGDVENQLYGGQLGIEGVIWQNCRWEIEGGLKCGIYHNSADFDAAFPQAGPAAVFRAAEEHTAFSGELWLGVNYHLTDCIALKLGYQAMWMEGVAILPEQLDDLAVPILGDLDMGGSPLYHGASFGAQLAW